MARNGYCPNCNLGEKIKRVKVKGQKEREIQVSQVKQNPEDEKGPIDLLVDELKMNDEGVNS